MAINFLSVAKRPQKVLSNGVRFDFLNGLRLLFPSEGGPWHLVIKDLDSGIVVFDDFVDVNKYIETSKKYYVHWYFEITNPDKGVHRVTCGLEKQDVVIQMPVGTIGDPIAWVQHIEAFRKKHKPDTLICICGEKILDLLEETYPEISFCTLEMAKEFFPEGVEAYANYNLGIFKPDAANACPMDYRLGSLGDVAASILGMPLGEPFNVYFKPQAGYDIPKEPYACIATQSTGQYKYWNNPDGWEEVVDHLKSKGLRVLCIDGDAMAGFAYVWNRSPANAENFCGRLPLQQRVALLQNAKLFVGLSSGLSWLANASGCKVVMISGFSHPRSEFYTPYRVFNPMSCNSCWNKHVWDENDYFWCPEHKGTDRQFECSRLITSKMVIDMIDRALEGK